jgi:DNA repair exonuclease SbcCD ATPase subunit
MIIKKITIDNFYPFDYTELDLEAKTYTIVGINHDDEGSSSNGAGKSVFLYSLVWALFGEIMIPGLNADGIIGPNRKHVNVILEFEHAGKEYKIDRSRKMTGRKNSDIQIFIDGKDVTRHKDNDEFIQEQLGFNFSAFLLSAFADTQPEHVPFSKLTPTVMLKKLDEILELDRFDIYLDQIKKMKESISDQISSENRSIFSLERDLTSSAQNIERLQAIIDSFEQVRRAEVTSRQKELIELNRELNATLAFLQENADSCRELKAQIQEEQKLFENLKLSLSKREKEVVNLDHSIKSKLEKIENTKTKKKDTQSKIDNLSLNMKGQCNYCGGDVHSISEEKLNSLLTKFVEELDSHSVQEALLKAEIVDVKKDKNNILPEIDSLKEKISQALKNQEKVEIINNMYNTVVMEEKSVPSLRLRQEKLLKEIDYLKKKNNNQELELLEKLKEEKVLCTQALADKKQIILDLEDLSNTLKVFNDIVKLAKKEYLYDFIACLEKQIQTNLTQMGSDLKIALELDGKEMKILYNNTSKGTEYLPYAVFSRGEKVRIDKAVSQALNELFDIGLYMDDEGLSALDTTGAKLLIPFLIQDNSSTRFLVFHNEQIQEYLKKYKNISTLIVEKKNGKSKIYEV